MKKKVWIPLMVGIALAVSSCAYFLPDARPILFGMLADRGDTRPFEKLLPINKTHKRLAIGSGVTVGVKEDGTVWSWGQGMHGEMGDGQEFSRRYVPTMIPGMTGFVEVAGEGEHFLALRSNGEVWSWGSNSDGQLGYLTDKKISSAPQRITSLKNIVSIAASSGHSIALDDNGKIFTFGSNDGMQLGVSPADNKPHPFPEQRIAVSDAVKVFASGATSVVLTTSGEVYLCGGYSDGDRRKYVLPTKINFNIPISDVAVGQNIVALGRDGHVWVLGDNNRGMLGQGDYLEHVGPVQVKNIGRIVDVAAEIGSGIALDEEGEVWQWGSNVRIPPIAGVQENSESLPILIGKYLQAKNIESGFGNAVLLEDGQVYFWGWNMGGKRGTGNQSKDQIKSKDWMVPEKSMWTWK